MKQDSFMYTVAYGFKLYPSINQDVYLYFVVSKVLHFLLFLYANAYFSSKFYTVPISLHSQTQSNQPSFCSLLSLFLTTYPQPFFFYPFFKVSLLKTGYFTVVLRSRIQAFDHSTACCKYKSQEI